MTLGRRLYWIVALVAVLAIAAVAVTVTSQFTFAGGDDDQPITGPALEKCTAAALAEHPGGTVTETEVGDDGAAYGVEISADGRQFEVNLDENCHVIGQEADDDGPGDEDGPNDD